LESNWVSAEDTRQSFMEGSQFRKTRDERHRERGMERQAASIEQMKQAKGRVEEHRQSNLDQGKDVREDVASWKVAMYEQQEAWVEHGKQLKEKITTMERQRAERDALAAHKKKFSADVRKEVQQLSSDADAQKEKVLASNRAQADKVKKETADEVTDAAKKIFFEQRRAAALATTSLLKGLEIERKDIRNKFREDSYRNREKSRKIVAAAKGSRTALQQQRIVEAQEVRAKKEEVKESYRKMQESHAALVKQVVNQTAVEKYATPINSRRMLQHPHYQEVTAVITDVTSQISKEIASSPRRRPAYGGKPGTPALRGSSPTRGKAS